jgi:carbonic anhydrase/acetyltransferase-like protein (isoleucine patch superfamily)
LPFKLRLIFTARRVRFKKGSTHVELSVVAVVPSREIEGTYSVRLPDAVASDPMAFGSSRKPILGNDVLNSWADRVRGLGVRSLWLASGGQDGSVDGPTLAKFVRQGVERLLLIKLKSYAEMDLADLLRFHSDRGNPITEAQDARGELGVCLLDRIALHSATDEAASYRATDCGQTPYQFNGYAKRILSATERQELVGDGLTGACAMKPLGTQIRDKVWVGEGVKIAPSARIIGPVYIGARTTIGAGATVGPFSSVEHDCVIDCGTTVEQSTVLPNSYLAPGLLIRNSQVDGRHLEHLRWGAVADLQPAKLGRRIQPRGSRRPLFSKTDKNDFFARPGGPFPREFGTAPAMAQPWLQVQL